MCGCGCNTCETKGPLLTENKIKSLLSEGLNYHIKNNIPLYESVYRIGSDAHLSLIKEARQLYSRNVVDLCEDDVELVKTHLGEFGMYKGESVPLDLPMLNEQMDVYDDVANMEFGMDYDQLGSNEKEWVRDEIDNMKMRESLNEDKSEDLLDKILQVLQRIEIGDDEREDSLEDLDLSIDYLSSILSKKTPFDIDIDQKQLDRFAQPAKEGVGADLGPGPKAGPDGVKDNSYVKEFGYKLVPKKIKGSGLEVKKLYEDKNKKKDPPLGKPKRGGSKAYYVYVRDPKTKKIKKVSFGSGGLRAKIKNKQARNAFAKRHNCKNKKDRTTAGYWSCNLPRYASQLGLGANMNTFW
jgi:hypothetical protein